VDDEFAGLTVCLFALSVCLSALSVRLVLSSPSLSLFHHHTWIATSSSSAAAAAVASSSSSAISGCCSCLLLICARCPACTCSLVAVSSWVGENSGGHRRPSREYQLGRWSSTIEEETRTLISVRESTDRQTETQTNRQRHRQTDRQTDTDR